MPEIQEIPGELRKRWIQAEDDFFAGLPTQDPDLYQNGIQIVRSLADSLEDLLTPPELVEAHSARDREWARQRVESVLGEVPGGLDLETARDAAFQLRLNELRPMISEILSTWSGDRPRHRNWVKLYESSGDYTGRPYHRRFDFHPERGESLYLHPFLTASGQYVHQFERARFQPESGERSEVDDPESDENRYPNPEEAHQAYQSELTEP